MFTNKLQRVTLSIHGTELKVDSEPLTPPTP